MNTLDNSEVNSKNQEKIESQEKITEKTESSISDSLSKTPLTLDQKMEKLVDGMQNMTNGINQLVYVFKEMMKGQMDAAATMNKFIAKEAERWEDKDTIRNLETQKYKIKSDKFRKIFETALTTQKINKNSYVLLE